MPTPISIPSLLPDWTKTENASVFDPPYKTAIRDVVKFLGLDDPTQIMNVGMPMMTLAPKVPASELIERLAPAGKASTEVRSAVDYLVQRFPRLMSHVSAVNAAPLNVSAEAEKTVMGRVLPDILAKVPRLANEFPDGAPGMRAPIATIQYDPQAIQGNALQTLSHEATHVAQTLRQTDLARRIPGEPTFNELYSRMSQAQGYFNNPMEVAARDTAESVLLKKNRIFDPMNVAKMVYESTGDQAVVERRLRQVFPTALDSELTTAIRAATGNPEAVVTPLPPMPTRR